MNVREFLDTASWPEILDRVIALVNSSGDDGLDDLSEMMTVKLSVFVRFEFARLVAAALVQKGPEGINRLRQALHVAPHNSYANAALEAIYCASEQGLSPFVLLGVFQLPRDVFRAPTTETFAFARTAFEDIILESQSDPDLFDRVISFLQIGSVMSSLEGGVEGDGGRGRFRDSVLRVLRDSALQLRPSVISEFKGLIAIKAPEERYQEFLAAHPVLLDVLAGHVIRKQKLGLEHVTDFVLHRLDDQFVLVEIERPDSRIFTQADNFSAPFSHALGQVLDFKAWVGENLQYARNLIPGISATPLGMLVMGLRSDLTSPQSQKLRAFNENSSAVSVVTFDDLVLQAETIYRNMTQRQ